MMAVAAASFHPRPPPSSTITAKPATTLPVLPHHHLLYPQSPPPPPPPVLTTRNNPPLTAASPRRQDAGAAFREKLHFIEFRLGLDPFEVISLNPDLRALPLAHLRLLRSVLCSFGLRQPDITRILLMYPGLLTADPLLLQPVLRFLRHDVALPTRAHIRLAVIRCPRLLLTPVDLQLLPALNFLRRLGVPLTPATTLLLISSVESTLIPKLHFLQSLGFSSLKAADMVIRFPRIFTYSIDLNLRPKHAFLVDSMQRNVRELFKFPEYFAYSLNGRIRPRHTALLRHGFHRVSLFNMLTPSDTEFEEKLLEKRLARLQD